MSNKENLRPDTLGKLKNANYRYRSIHEEMRENLISKIARGEKIFDGIMSYDDSVLPDVERAILSRHNILFLGLRGQAKTRIARLMTGLLDEFMPVIRGSDLNENPFRPISISSKKLIEEMGDDTPLDWIHRSDRYTEKLATPDVTVADLIGDVDPIKAASLKLPYSDERVIHYGLIPRANRGIFVINELPDLQARIQVSLFNILQEGDVQIRGFKLRLPLDIMFVFTANPEDYTNRGSIVTPLKDRIESQILTHYPRNRKESVQITRQEASLHDEQRNRVKLYELAEELLEQIAFEARQSEFVDPKSGVSARLSISGIENLYSTAERRMLKSGDSDTCIRITDFWGVIPSITGKIELVYEGEQEGPLIVAQNLISKSIRSLYANYFPDPEKMKRKKDANPYIEILEWFGAGNEADLLNEHSNKQYKESLEAVKGLKAFVKRFHPKAESEEILLMMEFVLHALSEFSLLSRKQINGKIRFRDLFSTVLEGGSGDS
ncbi:MAG: magnesium chelatase [Bacteroidetes bacterium]|nr:MAG: magnesium chelatase [Bacteroidota bacterium]REK08189.1 MAG: magnesium chelatase [Bacteroidota bacterium]REK32394.1 MAG: magnesium chelatase [Bacteroidota bacterium]REK49617.1 MAG: magnesium chelatase [Bacteroidota bacterium]